MTFYLFRKDVRYNPPLREQGGVVPVIIWTSPAQDRATALYQPGPVHHVTPPYWYRAVVVAIAL